MNHTALTEKQKTAAEKKNVIFAKPTRILDIVIYEALCFDVAQGRLNESQTLLKFC